LLLRGTSGRIRAVIIVNIDEDQSKLEFRERFSGFLELWRYRSVEGDVYRDGHRVPLFDPNGGIMVTQKDIYGDAKEAPASGDRFLIRAKWLVTNIRSHYQHYLLNRERRQQIKERLIKGDVGKDYELPRRRNG
jgi:hypothetical protein